MIRSFPAVLSSLLLLASAPASRGAAMPPTRTADPDSLPPRRVVLSGIVDVPLLHPNARDSRPEVEAMVNGRGPYRFYLETGAREIDLSPALAATLGLTRTGTSSDDRPLYHVDSITVGAASFQGMTVAAFPDGVTNVDGVLGLPFYQNIDLTIDYPAGRVRLERDSLPAADSHTILQLTRISDYWGLPVRIAGHDFMAVLDTQNSGSIGLPPGIAAQLPFDGGLQVIGKARGVFGTVDVQGGILAGEIRIGAYTIPRPFLNVLQLPPDFPDQPNVGSRLLDQFVVTLDQRHGRLRLLRDSGTVITLAQPRTAPARPATPHDSSR